MRRTKRIAWSALATSVAVAACGGATGGSSADGGACSEGQMLCGTACTRVLVDPANCGACGVTCGDGKVCIGGTCLTPGGGDAGAASHEAGTRPDAGPGSDAALQGDASVGLDGGVEGDAGGLRACPAASLCAGACVDLRADPAHCGACTTACATGQICTGGTCGAPTSDWPMFGFDAQHSGYNALETGKPPAMGSTPWSVTVSGPQTQGGAALHPAASDGARAFVTPDSSFATSSPLLAVALADGKTLWSHDFGNVENVGHPSVVGGTVYVQTNKGTTGNATDLWALDASTGNLLWAAPYGSQWERFWAPLVVGSTVYVDGGEYGGLLGFRTVDGAQLFFNAGIGQYDSWSPAYFHGALYTFIAGTFSSEDPVTGVVQSTTKVPWTWTGYTMNTAPVFGPTLAYVIAPPALAAIDPAKNAVAWSVNGSFSGTPAVAGGVVYAVDGGNLLANDAATGALVATMVGDSALKYPPVVAAGHVYAASDANVYAWDAATRTQAWTATVGGWLSIAGGKLLVSSGSGVLHGFTLSP